MKFFSNPNGKNPVSSARWLSAPCDLARKLSSKLSAIIMNRHLFPHPPVRLWHERLLFCVLALLLTVACSSNKYIWASEVPAERARPDVDSVQIRRGDVLSVQVVGQPNLSGQQPVGADGTISLMDVGGVTVAGLTAQQAQELIQKKLSAIFQSPRVSVVLMTRYIEVTILGEVRSPGKFLVQAGDGVANAIAMAGGITEFGNESGIYLVRATEPVRIRFRMRDLLRGGSSAVAFALRDGDILFVE